MAADDLPVPWLGANNSACFSIPGLIAWLESQNLPAGSARRDLLLALRHAEFRAHDDPWELPDHVRYGQAVLEIAVEWAMPAVERWAVAWLTAAGGSHLRLRWSSHSRDGKVRRNGRTAAPIVLLASGTERVIVVCQSREVAAWTDEAGLRRLEQADEAVWTIAARGDRILLAGEKGYLSARPEGWRLPPLTDSRRGGPTASAISVAGAVAVGDNIGQVWVCPPGGEWLELLCPDDSDVLALAFTDAGTLRAVWGGGWIATSTALHSGEWEQLGPQRLRADDTAGTISAAAFDHSGEQLAIAAADLVSVVDVSDAVVTRAWSHPGVQHVAWSPDGLLASSGNSTVLIGDPGRTGTDPEPIKGEAVGGPVAFLGADHVVTALDTDIAQWAVREAGSDVPDVDVEDTITAVAIDPQDPSRTMAGTQRGRVLCYDRRGAPALLLVGLGGRVHELAPFCGDWLVASRTGAYRWRYPAGTAAIPLGEVRRMCLAVTASANDGAFASNNEVFTLSSREPLVFARVVLDARFGDDGSLAAVDEGGTIRVRDAEARWCVPGSLRRSGWRLVTVGRRSVVVWHPGGKVLSVPRSDEIRVLGQVADDASAVLMYTGPRVVVVRPDRGLGVADLDSGLGRTVTGVAARVATAFTDGRRIVAASGKRVAGYDVLEPAATDGAGILPVQARYSGDGCTVELPGGAVVEIGRQRLAGLRLAIEQQSKLVATASTLGDQLWWAGMDLAADLARGNDPNRPLRIEWTCDEQADEIPWELVSPSAAPLGWFADPPVTVVRSIASGRPRPAHDASAHSLLARRTMLVIRGAQNELRASDSAYAWTQRRTRRSNVRVLKPLIISKRDQLSPALPETVDILQLWAHCGPTGVQFSDRAKFETVALADELVRCAPRLAILIGCQSGALGRALVERGVEAVVAMRVQVYSQTIQPLVADLVSLVLDGTPVDLAFAEALRSYVLTGQPGAAAIPLLYLAAGSTGALFPPPTPAPSSHAGQRLPEDPP